MQGVELDRWHLRRPGASIAGTLGLIGGATLLVAILQGVLGVPDPSSAYLLAILLSAGLFGTVAGIAAAVGAFILYNFLFTDPRYTFVVADPGQWLNLIVLLIVGVAVGQLAGALRARAETAIAREREARALFQVSRALATRSATVDVLGPVAEILRTEADMERVWIGMSRSGGSERIVADTGGSADALAPAASQSVLRRMPGDVPAQWVRVHRSTGRRGSPGGPLAHRVAIEAGGQTLGSLWALRPRVAGAPGPAETRLLAAAADQIGQALEQDRLAEEASSAEIARRSDELKSALLDSVSHDLKTPLATIRAAAGTILDRQIRIPEEDLVASAEAIDREAEHLNRVVTNLLDLSRIEAGALRPELEPTELEELVRPTIARLGRRLGHRTIDVEWPDHLPPVLADPIYVDQIMTNLLENATKYVPDRERIRVSGSEFDGTVRLTVEDSGPGVSTEDFPHLFEKFFRVAGSGRRSRPGTGVGLAVVRGLSEAMGGAVRARVSSLGGLAIDVDLPIASIGSIEPNDR